MTEQHTIQETDKQPESCYSIESSAEPVDSSSWLTEYNELFYNDMDDYWEPPISPAGLAQIARAIDRCRKERLPAFGRLSLLP